MRSGIPRGFRRATHCVPGLMSTHGTRFGRVNRMRNSWTGKIGILIMIAVLMLCVTVTAADMTPVSGILSALSPGIRPTLRDLCAIMIAVSDNTATNMLFDHVGGAGAINAFLDTLPYEDRFLFMRRYWYADPLPEIAETAGMRYQAAAVRLHRVREKLRKYLKKEGVPV